MLNKLQTILDRINDRFGGVGSVIAVLFWMAILALAIRSMLAHA